MFISNTVTSHRCVQPKLYDSYMRTHIIHSMNLYTFCQGAGTRVVASSPCVREDKIKHMLECNPMQIKHWFHVQLSVMSGCRFFAVQNALK